MKYSKDGKVSFNAEKHIYLLGDKVLKGVTSLIGTYKNFFDKDKVAETFAQKNGLNKDEVLREWELKGLVSREQGTAVHSVFENYHLLDKIETTGLYKKELQAVKFINDYFKTGRLIPVEAEMIVYNESVASQIDYIVKTPTGEHFIFDFKTNKSIETNGYNKYMLHPFNNMPDASFYHYSLQLNIYKELCKEYDIKGLFIIHLTDNDYKIIKAKKITIPHNILNF